VGALVGALACLLSLAACSSGAAPLVPSGAAGPVSVAARPVSAAAGVASASTRAAAQARRSMLTREAARAAAMRASIAHARAAVTRHEPLVVLDPGHNGGNASHPAEIDRLVPMGFGKMKPCNTTGTATDAGYPEHAFNWDVVQRIRRILQAHHIRVLMTRHGDTGVGPCVNRRAAIESTKGVAAAVAIHADGTPSSGHGFHVCTASRRPVHASGRTMARSHEMAIKIHSALVSQSGLVPSTYIGLDGFFRRSDEAGLNLSSKPTTFLELGNMRNAHDALMQSSRRGRERIAHAVAVGIINYLHWLLG
jgi:N-acetylmuramoyl-L-alanine amidase